MDGPDFYYLSRDQYLTSPWIWLLFHSFFFSQTIFLTVVEAIWIFLSFAPWALSSMSPQWNKKEGGHTKNIHSLWNLKSQFHQILTSKVKCVPVESKEIEHVSVTRRAHTDNTILLSPSSVPSRVCSLKTPVVGINCIQSVIPGFPATSQLCVFQDELMFFFWFDF